MSSLSKFLLSSLCATAFAQTDIDLSGKVLDGNNNAVPFVEVEVESLGLRDTTDSQGMWSIKSSASSVQQVISTVLDARIDGGVLNLNLQNAAFVSVEIMDLGGARSSVLGGQQMATGSHRIALDRLLPFGQYYLRVWAGSSSRTFAVNYASPSARLSAAPVPSAATITDKLVYRLQGQILTADQISKYQQYIEKFLQIRNVSGLFNPGTSTINKIYATFSGGAMPLPAVVRLGWLSSTNSYTGKVYSVRPLGSDVFDYSVFAYGVDSLGHKSTQSPTLNFDSYAGDLELLPVSAGNAYPILQVNGPAELSVNDTLRVSLSDSDAYGGRVVNRQVRFNGGAWQSAMGGMAKFVVPAVAGTYTIEARVMDEDSNWVSRLNSVSVVEDVPVVGIQGPSPLAINTIGKFQAVVTDKYGDTTKFKYEWDVGSGYQVGTKTLETKWLSAGVQNLKLRVSDDDNKVGAAVLPVNVVNDTPVAIGLVDQSLNKGDRVTFALAVSDNDGIKKVIWDFGHGAVGNPQFDTTVRGDSSVVSHLWDSVGMFELKITIFDNLGFSSSQTIKVWVYDNFIDLRDGKKYKQVQIGDQVWMAENLNFLPTGKDKKGAWCYGNLEANCALYGRLYDWSTAMDSTPSSATAPSGVTGVCPSGWHLPSDHEWAILEGYIDQENSFDQVGKSLKTLLGKWYYFKDILSTNQFGFAAVPSGYYDGLQFSVNGHYAKYWSSTGFDQNKAWARGLVYHNDTLGRDSVSKQQAYSVRCLRNGGAEVPLPRIRALSGNFVDADSNYVYKAELSDYSRIKSYEWRLGTGPWIKGDSIHVQAWTLNGPDSLYLRVVDTSGHVSSTVGYHPTVYGRLVDARDAKSYRTVPIGSQVWMVDNLAYKPVGGVSLWYNNDSLAYSGFGRLYNWITAMDGAMDSNDSMQKIKGICPNGWHVPSTVEWNGLVEYVDAHNGNEDVGRSLRSDSSLWVKVKNQPNLNQFGFSALPTGTGIQDNAFIGMNFFAEYFTSNSADSVYAHCFDIKFDMPGWKMGVCDRKMVVSYIRCLQD